MSDDRNKVIFEMWRAREKRCYFLMSSAGAGIGYAPATVAPNLNTIEKSSVILALSFWSFSFIFGLRVLSFSRMAMDLSKSAIQYLRKLPLERIQFGTDIVANEAEKMAPKMRFAHSAQVGLLPLGALIYSVIKLEPLARFLDPGSTQ